MKKSEVNWTEAGKKAWVTRRANELKRRRSESAKKSAETRRKNRDVRLGGVTPKVTTPKVKTKTKSKAKVSTKVKRFQIWDAKVEMQGIEVTVEQVLAELDNRPDAI